MRRVLDTLNRALEDYGRAHDSHQKAYGDFHSVLGDTVARAKEVGLTDPRISGHIGMVVKATRLLKESAEVSNLAHNKSYQMLSNAATGLSTILGLDPVNTRTRQVNANQNVNYDRDIRPEAETRNISAATVRAGALQTSRGGDITPRGGSGDRRVYGTIDANLQAQAKSMVIAALRKQNIAPTEQLVKSAMSHLAEQGIFLANPASDLRIQDIVKALQESLKARGIPITGDLVKDLQHELTGKEIDTLNKALLKADTPLGNLDKFLPGQHNSNVARAASKNANVIKAAADLLLTTGETMSADDWAAYRADLAAGKTNSEMCKKAARCAGAKRRVRKMLY